MMNLFKVVKSYSFNPAMKNHIKQISDRFNRTQYPRPLLDKFLTFVLFFYVKFLKQNNFIILTIKLMIFLIWNTYKFNTFLYT